MRNERCLGEVLHTVQLLTLEDVRSVASRLPRSVEAVVRGRVKFRVGRIVYLAAARDETMLGFAFPKEEREALVASDPGKFLLPRLADMRYHWVVVRLAEIDYPEMAELVVDAWRMVVPRFLARGTPEVEEIFREPRYTGR